MTWSLRWIVATTFAVAVGGMSTEADAQDSESCQQQRECREEGRCSWDGEGCVARSDWNCLDAEVCRERGRCAAERGRCVADSDHHCVQSSACATGGRCSLSREEQACVDARPRHSTGMVVGGGILAGLGGASVVTGAVFAVLGGVMCNMGPGEPGPACHPAFPTSFILGGLALGGGAGVPLLVIGNAREDGGDAYVPQLSLAPTGANLRWRF